MGAILHVCNWFDPAEDIVRCVAELKKHSRHEHELIVAEPHMSQHVYGFQPAELMKWNTCPGLVEHLFDWADGILYQHTGCEDGWHREGKPQAYRNMVILYDSGRDRFWTLPERTCKEPDHYKLLASSHVGAVDFLPGCRFLPDLIPIFDALYTPDFSERPPCVSYIKHSSKFRRMDFGPARKQSVRGQFHPVVLWKRKTEATVVIDNVCDGHYGLAGCESLSLGLPCIVFLHEKTKTGLEDLAPETNPFIEVGPWTREAAGAARKVLEMGKQKYRQLRQRCRRWAEQYYCSERLIEKYWDPFFDELLS